ncbi:MAG: peptide ABC transporter substrate-binding protein [Dehalococcoidales bacterium]|nr:peptide ABC transporter substrate-binding protein [Dehalococcoidales bacterium]
MKKLIPAIVSLILVSVLLALCLPSCIVEPDQTEITTTHTDRTGETVLNLYGIDPYSLDPATIGDATSISYIIQIFSGLFRFNDDMEIVSDIAGDWDISNDGTIYTFYLRDDVRFHSGKKVTAEDIKYSWERACRPATGSQTAATYLGDIVGAGEVLTGDKENISGIEVIDGHTLRVTIEEPKSYFLYKMTYAAAFVVNRDNVESGKDWWRNPDGTGPFILKQWDESSLLVLERNDYYNPVSSFLGVNRINFKLWAGRPMDLYETGQIDIGQVSPAYIDKITDTDGDFYTQLEIFPELNLTYLGFNCTKEPFDDVDIRRAFSMAIDKDKLVSLIYKNTMSPADGILPPGMPGFNDLLNGLDYDVELANKLIADSKYGSVSNLPPIKITIGGWGGQIPSELEAIIHEWRINLGVEVEVRQLEPEVYLYELMQEKDEMLYWGWSADYPHPQNFLEVLFASGSEYNVGGYSSQEVDSLLQMASREQDREASLELYRQSEQLLVSDAACLPLWYGKSYVLVKPYVEGYRLNPLGYAVLNEVTIGPD